MTIECQNNPSSKCPRCQQHGLCIGTDDTSAGPTHRNMWCTHCDYCWQEPFYYVYTYTYSGTATSMGVQPMG